MDQINSANMIKALIYVVIVIICLAALTTELGKSWHGCWDGYYAPVCEHNLSINNAITYDIQPSTGMCQLETSWDGWDERELPNGTNSMNIRWPGNATRITVGSTDSNPPLKVVRVQQLVLENCLIYWNDLIKIMYYFPIRKLILENCMDEFVTGEIRYFNSCLRTNYNLDLPGVYDIQVSSSVVRPVNKAFTTEDSLQWPDTTRASFSG